MKHINSYTQFKLNESSPGANEMEVKIASLLKELHIPTKSVLIPPAKSGIVRWGVDENGYEVVDIRQEGIKIDSTRIFEYTFQKRSYFIKAYKLKEVDTFTILFGYKDAYGITKEIQGVHSIEELRDVILDSIDISSWLLKMNESSFSNEITNTVWQVRDILDKYKVQYTIKEFNNDVIKTGYEFKFKYKNDEQLILIEDEFDGSFRIYFVFNIRGDEDTQSIVDSEDLEECLHILSKEDTRKAMFKMNEELSEETIKKDPNTTPVEKENQMIKLNIDQYNKYKSKKAVFDRMFGDIETEIDVPTLNRLIDLNPFLRAYSDLLYKKRDSILTQKLITNKEEKVKQLKDKSRDINTTDIPDTYSGTNEDLYNEDAPDVNDMTSDIRNEISQLEKEVKELKQKLSKNDIDKVLSKWDSQMIKTIRDLKSGKPLLISNLSHSR